MKSASITDIKIMNPTHDAWKMKFGSSTFEPIRIKYKLGSNIHYLYYIFGGLLSNIDSGNVLLLATIVVNDFIPLLYPLALTKIYSYLFLTSFSPFPAAPSGTTKAKCQKSVTCGHMEKWFYINGAKSDNTQGKTGKAIGVAKREWIKFPRKYRC